MPRRMSDSQPVRRVQVECCGITPQVVEVRGGGLGEGVERAIVCPGDLLDEEEPVDVRSVYERGAEVEARDTFGLGDRLERRPRIKDLGRSITEDRAPHAAFPAHRVPARHSHVPVPVVVSGEPIDLGEGVGPETGEPQLPLERRMAYRPELIKA